MLWRQGDIFIAAIPSIPAEAVRTSAVVLAEGELTGHSHRVEDANSATIFVHRGQMLLHVVAPQARLVHEEHGTIELSRGAYRVWRQREYDPLAGRRQGRFVMD